MFICVWKIGKIENANCEGLTKIQRRLKIDILLGNWKWLLAKKGIQNWKPI